MGFAIFSFGDLTVIFGRGGLTVFFGGVRVVALAARMVVAELP
jgi:hypothetical protein